MQINPGTPPAPDRSSFAWLAGIVAAGIAARLLLLWLTPSGWIDPDHYMSNGGQLATGPGSWFDRVVAAAAYPFAGLTFYLPPLYPVFLSIFAWLPGYPLPAAIAQCLVGGLAPAALFVIGQRLDSRRTGLVAAAVFAAWPPGVSSAHVFMQEQIYIPLLVLAFALFVRYYDEDRPVAHLAAGAVFGLAAITRAMILYYVVALPAMVLLATWSFRRLRRQMLPLLAGAAIVIVPYSVFISMKTGQTMVIENHAGFDMMRYSDGSVDAKPTVNTGLAVVVDAIVRRPAAFAAEWCNYVRTLFKPFGTRWVEGLGPFRSRRAAIAATGARLLVDGLYLGVLGLAPVGLVLVRSRRPALILAAWVALVAAATAFSGVGGARYRTPVDPILIVLAAAAVCHGWRPRVVALSAAVVGVAIVVMVSAGVPGAATTPMYGFASWSPEQGVGRCTGGADCGLMLPPQAFGVALVFPDRRPADGMVRVRISLDGAPAVDRRIVPAGDASRFTWARSGYARIRVTDEATGRAVPFDVIVLR